MKAIAHLEATAIKSDVFEWAISKPCIDPVTEDSLIGATKLPRAGKDPATINPNRKIERSAILQRQRFGSNLRAAVKGHRRSRQVILGHSIARDPIRESLACDRPICPVKFLDLESA